MSSMILLSVVFFSFRPLHLFLGPSRFPDTVLVQKTDALCVCVCVCERERAREREREILKSVL